MLKICLYYIVFFCDIPFFWQPWLKQNIFGKLSFIYFFCQYRRENKLCKQKIVDKNPWPTQGRYTRIGLQCFLMYPAKHGKLAQQGQLQENLKQPDGSRRGWAKCKLIDILNESGRYWNHNIMFLSNKFNQQKNYLPHLTFFINFQAFLKGLTS